MNPSLEALPAARDEPDNIVSMPAEAAQPSIKPACGPRDDLLGVYPGPDDAPTDDRAKVWEIVGCVIVLAFVGGVVGLWAWTFTEFLRLLLELIPWLPA